MCGHGADVVGEVFLESFEVFTEGVGEKFTALLGCHAAEFGEVVVGEEVVFHALSVGAIEVVEEGPALGVEDAGGVGICFGETGGEDEFFERGDFAVAGGLRDRRGGRG